MLPNYIIEDVDPRPEVSHEISVLDTLYDAAGFGLPSSPLPAMTFYHGAERPPFVFSGLSPWAWTREDAQGLVDFVMQDIWGLQRTAPITAAASLVSRTLGRPVVVRRATKP
jgi:hypothetical protein